MKRNILILFMIGILASPAFGQLGSLRGKKKNNPFNFDAPPKWRMGPKVGYNKSRINIKESYTVFSPLDITSSAKEKTYDKKQTSSYLIGWVATFYPINNIGISFQPALFNYKYAYTSNFDWIAEASSNLNYSLQHRHTHKLSYLELPLLLRLYPINGNVHAFLQGGAYYNKLLNAKKTIESKGVDNPGAEEFISTDENQSMDVNDSYIKTYTGWIIGGGAGFNADNFRFALEINYRKGINNIVNEKNRYKNNQLTNAYYDVPDDIALKNLEISLTCTLPLDNLVHVAKKTEMPKKKR
jgi:hypothetical protein